jgi:hypothetical protein
MGIKTISGAVLTTVLLGTVTAFAHPPCGEMPHLQPPPIFECNQPPPPPLPPEMPAAVRDQVEDLLDAEQVAALPLLQKLQKNRHALRKASHLRPFDEVAVTALAKEQAALQAELLVSRLRTQSRIHGLLEQNRPSQK